MPRIALLLVLAVGCRHDEDKCERVVRRMELASSRPLPAAIRASTLEQCRRGETSWDPVYNCAFGAATDDAAVTCIRTGVESVLGKDPAHAPSPGRGLNPLLSPSAE